MSDVSVAELVLKLNEVKIKDMVELVRELEDEWGVSATPQAHHIGVAAAYGAIEPRIGSSDPLSRDVQLVSFGPKKISIIKSVRAHLGLGLKEAKELVDSAPCHLGQFDSDVAQQLAQELADLGADVELQ